LAFRDSSLAPIGHDLRTLDRHPGGATSGLIPSLSCRRCDGFAAAAGEI
jgi:hypothetical protein